MRQVQLKKDYGNLVEQKVPFTVGALLAFEIFADNAADAKQLVFDTIDRVAGKLPGLKSLVVNTSRGKVGALGVGAAGDMRIKNDSVRKAAAADAPRNVSDPRSTSRRKRGAQPGNTNSKNKDRKSVGKGIPHYPKGFDRGAAITAYRNLRAQLSKDEAFIIRNYLGIGDEAKTDLQVAQLTGRSREFVGHQRRAALAKIGFDMKVHTGGNQHLKHQPPKPKTVTEPLTTGLQVSGPEFAAGNA